MKSMLNIIAIIIFTLITSCNYDGQYMSDYTSQRPQFVDVVGNYMFQGETIHESLDFKQASTSTIILRADGTFIMKNILNLAGDTGAYVSRDGLISATGKWSIKIDSVETSSRAKRPHWGIALTSVVKNVNFIGFLGDSPPYKLIINYSDPDLDQVMIFSKK
jgi:hypothetical protein